MKKSRTVDHGNSSTRSGHVILGGFPGLLALREGPGLGKGMVGPSLIPCSEPASRVRWAIRLYLDSRPLGLDKASTACRSFAAMRMVAKSVPRITV